MYPLYKMAAVRKVVGNVRELHSGIFDDTCHIHDSGKIMYVTDNNNKFRIIEELHCGAIHKLLDIGFSVYGLETKSGYGYTDRRWSLSYKNEIINSAATRLFINEPYDLMVGNSSPYHSLQFDNLKLCEYEGNIISLLLLIVDPLSYISKMREKINEVPSAVRFFDILEKQVKDTQHQQIQKYLVLKKLMIDDIIFVVIGHWVYIEEYCCCHKIFNMYCRDIN